MNENLFTGKWYIASRSELKMLLTRDKIGIFSWEFSEKYLIERCGERIVNRTFCFYYPAENELVIDRSDIAEDGLVWICHEDRYRVEKANDNSLILSDLREG